MSWKKWSFSQREWLTDRKEEKMIGKVESYDAKKGYGFIRGDDGKRYFVPYINVKTRSGSLIAGYTVDFNTGDGNKAMNVRLL